MAVNKTVNLNVKTKGAQKAEKEFKKVGKGVAFIEAALASAAIAGIGHLAKMGAAAVPVERAFARVANPALMEELQKATKGTVSELELMKRSVMAHNFRISLETLPKLFGFAQQRARETGQSVDFLVDSIVTGIGRKSPLILDNLGFSAIEVREEFKKTGDMAKAVANIIDKDFTAANNNTVDSIDQIDRIGASWENATLSLGKFIDVLTGGFGAGNAIADALDWVGDLTDDFTLMFKTIFNGAPVYNSFGAKTIEIANSVRNTGKQIDAATTAYVKWITEFEKKKQQKEDELGFWFRYNMELGTFKSNIIDVGNIQLQTSDKTVQAIEMIEESSNDLHDTWLDNQLEMIGSFENFGASMAGVLERAALSNQNFFDATVQGFKNMLSQMVAEFAARSAIFGLFSIFGGGSLLGGSSFILPRFAGGGEMQKGRPGIVGEQGPEIFIPRESGTIIPNDQTGQSITINFNGNMTDKRFVESFIIPQIQKSIRRGVA